MLPEDFQRFLSTELVCNFAPGGFPERYPVIPTPTSERVELFPVKDGNGSVGHGVDFRAIEDGHDTGQVVGGRTFFCQMREEASGSDFYLRRTTWRG
ncbi:MAG: hypothetical protein PHF57_04735 [Methanoregula sp.]|jgi:hypothetical protein|nr:hypothetical protein [Methanoregula sp.]